MLKVNLLDNRVGAETHVLIAYSIFCEQLGEQDLEKRISILRYELLTNFSWRYELEHYAELRKEIEDCILDGVGLHDIVESINGSCAGETASRLKVPKHIVKHGWHHALLSKNARS